MSNTIVVFRTIINQNSIYPYEIWKLYVDEKQGTLEGIFFDAFISMEDAMSYINELERKEIKCTNL
jgi:hypothetical protein